MSEGTLGKVNEVEAPGELFPIPPLGWALQVWEDMVELICAQCTRVQCFFSFSFVCPSLYLKLESLTKTRKGVQTLLAHL